MKNIAIITKCAAAGLFTLFLTAGCTGYFDKINTNPNMPEESDIDRDYLWGAMLTTMQRNVFPEQANPFQMVQDLFGNNYSGYFGATNNWNSGSNSTTYFFIAGWINEPFRVAYNDFLPSWNVLRQKVDSTSVTFAIGEVVKVEGMHRYTDMYGPLPYTMFGKKGSGVPYDSQEDIYRSFFSELDHAINILTDLYNQNPEARPLASFDLIYGSDLGQWIKFANSLKLRLAMRVRYVDEINAKKYAEEALAHPLGVIEDNRDNPEIKNNTALGFVYNNPLQYMWDDYHDSRMGANMESFLKGYNDPRLPLYFSPASYYANATGNDKFHGVRCGITNAQNYIDRASPATFLFSSPMRWMVASEVWFLRAEGALLGWDMKGTAGNLYNTGIEKSFELWGATGAAGYIANSTAKPAEYRDPRNTSSNNILSTSPLLSTITVKWNDADGQERNLERIITQKWLAMFPDGQEAWSEFRRTGYPKIFPVVVNRSGGKVNSTIQVRRIPLPESEYTGNNAAVQKAVTDFLGGSDTGGTRLWWDARNQ